MGLLQADVDDRVELWEKGDRVQPAEEVDTFGFTIGQNGVKPTSDFVEAVRNFPLPKDIKQTRAFFGLINQCTYAMSKDARAELAKMRDSLSLKKGWEWTQENKKIFENAKILISESIKNGIGRVEFDKTLVLRTDWSRLG